MEVSDGIEDGKEGKCTFLPMTPRQAIAGIVAIVL